MQVLALDVGTSSVKAAVVDVATAAPVGEVARAEYDLDHPVPEAVEIVPEKLWSAVTAAARGAIRGIETVDGIGLSCLTPALVLLDGRDRPLAPFWTHLDRRARPAARQVWAAAGEEFLRTVGSRPLPGGISALCYRQLLDEDPHLCRRVRWYLHVSGWLGLRLTGERAFDPANASFSGLYNTLTDRQWSPRWCDFFDVEPEWLPPVVCGRTTLGPLRPVVAAELGVPPGVPVKLGTADTSCAMLAAGLRRGELMHSVGTTQVLAALVDRPAPDPRRTVRLLGVGGDHVHVTHNPVGGVALDWLRELCFREQKEQEFYERTVPEAMERKTRVTMDPPCLGGDRLEIEACRAGFRDLTLESDRLDLLAALLQEMKRQHYRAVRALGQGEHFSRIVLTGGGADVVQKLIPEYAGSLVEPLEEGSLRGVACLWR